MLGIEGVFLVLQGQQLLEQPVDHILVQGQISAKLEKELQTTLDRLLLYPANLLVDVEGQCPTLDRHFTPWLVQGDAQWANVKVHTLHQEHLVLRLTEINADARRLRLHVVLKRRKDQNQLADQTTRCVDLQVAGCGFLVSQPVAHIEDLARDVLLEINFYCFMYRLLHY